MYFVIEITESCLDLTLFKLWNDHSLLEAWFLMAKMQCVCVIVSGWWLYLWAYRRWIPSEVRTLALEVEWPLWTVAEYGGASRREPHGYVYCPRVGTSHLKINKQRILSKGSPLLRSWVGSCSIEDEPFRGNCPNEDDPWEPRDGCLFYDSRVGVFLLGMHK